MKRIASFLVTLCLLQSAFAASAVPDFISFQGRALTSTGALMGSGTPVNRTVTFRVWDHATNSLAANLLYSEQQTVTIAEGEFSVLIGAGAATTGSPLGFSESTKGLPTVKISDVFSSATRYLGVTIDDGTAALDNEVSPRQQFVTSSYAMRAKVAETLGTSTSGNALSVLDSGNIGVGNSAPPARLTVTGANTGTGSPQLVLTATDTTERLRLGVDDTGSGTGFLQAYKEGSGAQNLLLNSLGGNVGIGTTTPTHTLSVAGSADVSGALIVTGAVTGASVTASGAVAGATVAATGNVSAASVTATGNVSAASFVGSGANLTSNTVALAALVDAVKQSLCPVGSIMPYAGDTAPAGWALCDGTLYSRTTYAALFAVMGTRFGSGDSTNFRVPDLRGRFLRGVDGGAGRDVDRLARISESGGASGDSVGSVQADALATHTHPYKDVYFSEAGGDTSVLNNAFGCGDNDNNNSAWQLSRTTTATGGNETRPKNVNVNYIIKY